MNVFVKLAVSMSPLKTVKASYSLRQKHTSDFESEIVGEAARVIAAMGPRAILGTIAWYLEF